MPAYRSLAIRRYTRRLAVLMVIYAACILTAGYLFRHYPLQGVAAYALAVLPAIPIIGVIWTIMRLLIEETDEYIRLQQTRITLFATGFCLSVMTVWEFLQNYDLLSHDTHGFGATFVWFVGLGIGAAATALAEWRRSRA